MPQLPEALLAPFLTRRRSAARLLSALPPYQVALWPDGWELLPDGAVAVRDTHAMAEARRWYLLAERNRSREDARRAMTMHGVFVPPSIVDMAGRRFPSEETASVAVQLVAGDWVRERRRQLLAAPASALAERDLAWCGSRHETALDAAGVDRLVRELIALCIAERAIPAAGYGVQVRADDGYGIRRHLCRIHVCLEQDACHLARETLALALTPWNRAVSRRGASAQVIAVEVCPGETGQGAA